MPSSAVQPDLFLPPHASPLRGDESALSASLKFIKNPLEGLGKEVYNKGLTRHRSLFVKMHVLTDPEGMSEVLVKKAKHFRKSELNQRIIEPVSKEGLVTAHGEQWKSQRRTIAPIFQVRHMEALSGHVIQAIDEFMVRYDDLGEPLDLQETMSDLTFNVLAKALLGDPQGVDNDKLKAAANIAISAAGKLRLDDFLPRPNWVPRFLGWRGQRAIRTLRRAAEKLLSDRQDDASADDLVGLLSHSHDPRSGRGLTLREQRDNLIGFFIAGHESTAIALTWAFYLIANHPDVQRRLRDEIDAVAGNGPLTFKHINDLVFTKAVIHETMRLYPSFPIIGREANCDTTILGKQIKKDEIVVLPIYVMHRSARYWENPNAFDPNRFMQDPKLAKRNPKFIPFGAGPRICIGASFAMMESVLMIANVIRRFDVSMTSTTKPKPVVTVSLRPDRKITLELQTRIPTN